MVLYFQIYFHPSYYRQFFSSTNQCIWCGNSSGYLKKSPQVLMSLGRSFHIFFCACHIYVGDISYYDAGSRLGNKQKTIEHSIIVYNAHII